MEMTGNETSEGNDADERDEYLAKWELGVLTSIFILTIVGNGLVLFALYLRKHRFRRKFTRMYFFIMHLSIADLLTGFLDVLPQLAWDITFRYSVTVFLLPFIVLVYTYTGICVGIWNSNKFSGIVDLKKPEKHSSFGIPASRSPFISKAMLNTVKQTVAVITLYVMTSMPFIGCQLYATWDPTAPSSPFFEGPAFTILMLLSSLTSCVNPWIYLWFNRELRCVLASYFCGWDDCRLTRGNREHFNDTTRHAQQSSGDTATRHSPTSN